MTIQDGTSTSKLALMKHLLSLLVLGFSLAGCGSDSSTSTTPTPTPAPTRVQVAGIWTITETRTSITGGECLQGTFDSTIGSVTTDTVTFTQNVAALTATTTANANGISCNWTGTADTDRFILNMSSCQTNASQFGLRCANGNVRDLRISSAAITAVINTDGSYTGTKADTYNITASGGFPQVGTMTFTETVSMKK